jgi:hypothetical protein
VAGAVRHRAPLQSTVITRVGEAARNAIKDALKEIKAVVPGGMGELLEERVRYSAYAAAYRPHAADPVWEVARGP